jgi:hypothetical protein
LGINQFQTLEYRYKNIKVMILNDPLPLVLSLGGHEKLSINELKEKIGIGYKSKENLPINYSLKIGGKLVTQ